MTLIVSDTVLDQLDLIIVSHVAIRREAKRKKNMERTGGVMEIAGGLLEIA